MNSEQVGQPSMKKPHINSLVSELISKYITKKKVKWNYLAWMGEQCYFQKKWFMKQKSELKAWNIPYELLVREAPEISRRRQDIAIAFDHPL